MPIPPDMHRASTGQVCKLYKSLDGIRLASKQWYENLYNFLISQCHNCFVNDHSLFLKIINNTDPS